jgi:hypothetical protein
MRRWKSRNRVISITAVLIQPIQIKLATKTFSVIMPISIRPQACFFRQIWASSIWQRIMLLGLLFILISISGCQTAAGRKTVNDINSKVGQKAKDMLKRDTEKGDLKRVGGGVGVGAAVLGGVGSGSEANAQSESDASEQPPEGSDANAYTEAPEGSDTNAYTEAPEDSEANAYAEAPEDSDRCGLPVRQGQGDGGAPGGSRLPPQELDC